MKNAIPTLKIIVSQTSSNYKVFAIDFRSNFTAAILPKIYFLYYIILSFIYIKKAHEYFFREPFLHVSNYCKFAL